MLGSSFWRFRPYASLLVYFLSSCWVCALAPTLFASACSTRPGRLPIFGSKPNEIFWRVFVAVLTTFDAVSRMPTSRALVVSVALICSKEKMIGIAARSVIATVTYDHSIRDRSFINSITEPMCAIDKSFVCHAPVASVSRDDFVMDGRAAALPFPAPRCLVDLDSIQKSRLQVHVSRNQISQWFKRFFLSPLYVMRLAQRTCANWSATAWKLAFHRL